MNNRSALLSIAAMASLIGLGDQRKQFVFRADASTGLRRRKYQKRGKGSGQKPYRKPRSDFQLALLGTVRSNREKNKTRPGFRKLTLKPKKIRQALDALVPF